MTTNLLYRLTQECPHIFLIFNRKKILFEKTPIAKYPPHSGMPKPREHALQNKQKHRESQLTEIKSAYSKQIATLELKMQDQEEKLRSIREELTKGLSTHFASSSKTLESRYTEIIDNAKEVSKCIVSDLDCELSPRTMKETIGNHARNLLGILDV